MLELDKETREAWGKYATDPEKMAEFSAICLIPWLLEHTQEEIVEKGQQAGIFATPYHTIETLLSDPHFRERRFWQEVDHPVMGKLTCPGPPFRTGKEGWTLRRPAPLLGQHNEEIFTEHKYSKEDLVLLKQTGII